MAAGVGSHITKVNMNTEERPRESERRQATVLFADISGFTAMSEQFDPEDLTDTMNRCFEMIERIVVGHGGHIDKYIGDCVMALFGVPTAIEHAPKQAVNAAIAIRLALDRFSQEQRLPARLEVHAGLNSGLVIAGDIGGQMKRDFTVMGDTVNVASRLKDASDNGQIFVGAETYYYTKDEFEYRPLKPLALKGRKEPVAAYELLSAKAKIHRPKVGSSSRAIASKMIGRDEELAQLSKRVVDTVNGEGGIVSVVGEAGLGKSRLLVELNTLEQVRHAVLLEGRSLSIGERLSFHPFIDLLRQWAGITDEDGEQESLLKLGAAVAAVAASESGEILPFIGTLMGIRLTGVHAERIQGIEGEALEKLVAKAMRDLLRHVAAHHPLILVLEDLHWADRSSINLLESLLRLIADSRILFVLVCRPDYPETSQRILQYVRDNHAGRHTDIRLQRLDEAQCDQLVRNLLQIEDLPSSTRAVIASKAEGNPFYIEEVVRSLIDQGALASEAGRLTVTAKIHAALVPGTIQEVIMARVDQLDTPTRRVLEVASVIGRSCYRRIIAEVLRGDPDLDERFAALKERQLLLERQSHRTATTRRLTLFEETEYVFHHALVQETIYAAILQRTRKELHLRVATCIESIFADRLADFYGMLAYHYSRAESLEKAEEYLFKAGDEAARAAASSEALTYFREASRMYFLLHGAGGDPNKKATLERNIGLALLNTGHLIECVPHFDRALEHLGERVPRSPAAATLAFAVNFAAVLFHLYVGRWRRTSPADATRARDVLEIMYSKARAQTTTDPQRFVFDSIASIRRLERLDPHTVEGAGGKYAGAAALFSFSGFSFAISRRFLAVARDLIRAGSVSDLFLYRFFLFLHNYFAGNWTEPCGLDDDLVHEVLRRGQVWDVDAFLGLDGEQQLDLGNFAAARARLSKISEFIDIYGYDFARSNKDALEAFIPLAQRDLPEALNAAERYYGDRHEELLNLIALGTKAKVQILLGEYTHADETLQRAAALSARLGTIPPFHAGAYRLARFLLDTCELERAVGCGNRAQIRAARRQACKSCRRALATAAKMARLRTEAYRITGNYYWALGRTRRAVRWWRRSIAEGERLDARPELARTYMEVCRRMAAKPNVLPALDGVDARAYWEKAHALFTAMDLRWDLEQLRAIRLSSASDRASAAA